MLNKTIRKSTILLFFFTMIVFFVIQLFFRDFTYFNFSEFQYLLATSISNAFVITTIYAIVVAFNMLSYSKKVKLRFLQVFKMSFVPGFIAGLSSLICVFLLFKYVDNNGIELLKNQYLDYSLAQAKINGDYEEVAKVINTDAVRSTQLLNYRTFTLILAVILFFNFSLALMVSFLWKIKTTEK